MRVPVVMRVLCLSGVLIPISHHSSMILVLAGHEDTSSFICSASESPGMHLRWARRKDKKRRRHGAGGSANTLHGEGEPQSSAFCLSGRRPVVGEGDSASCPGDPVDGPSCSPFVLLVTAGSWHCPFQPTTASLWGLGVKMPWRAVVFTWSLRNGGSQQLRIDGRAT